MSLRDLLTRRNQPKKWTTDILFPRMLSNNKSILKEETDEQPTYVVSSTFEYLGSTWRVTRIVTRPDLVRYMQVHVEEV
jgi:hypothetical protein